MPSCSSGLSLWGFVFLSLFGLAVSIVFYCKKMKIRVRDGNFSKVLRKGVDTGKYVEY
jgi:hypothetical protein